MESITSLLDAGRSDGASRDDVALRCLENGREKLARLRF